MAREILFKVKRIDNGEWVEGYLVKGKSYYDGKPMDIIMPVNVEILYMCSVSEYEIVDPNTICQYTGLTDKNGNKIFENDVVHLFGQDTIRRYDWKAVVEYGNPNSLYLWGYQLKPIGEFEYNRDILCWIGMEEVNIYCEVICNIFDNPELLKEG